MRLAQKKWSTYGVIYRNNIAFNPIEFRVEGAMRDELDRYRP
jgi:hypothetical protein